VDDDTIDLLLNWGTIVFIPVLPYVSWLQTKRYGLLIAFWQVFHISSSSSSWQSCRTFIPCIRATC
jgi:hypothetical protein